MHGTTVKIIQIVTTRIKNVSNTCFELWGHEWQRISFQPKHNDDHNKGITHTAKRENGDSNTSNKSQSRKRRHAAPDASDDTTQKSITSHNSEDVDEEEEEDEYAVFGSYVAHELRSLHSEDMRRDLKRIIQKAIIDMAELDDNTVHAQLDSTCGVVPALSSTTSASHRCSGDWVFSQIMNLLWERSSVQFVCSTETVTRKCLSLKVGIVNNENFRCVTQHHCTKENPVNLISYGHA